MSDKIFISPAKYVQGKGLIQTGMQYIIDSLGKKLLIIGDQNAYDFAGKQLCENLEQLHVQVHFEMFCGQSSFAEINRVAQIGEQGKYTAIIAVGGGKAADTARGVSHKLGICLGIVPTIAASDAPVASLYAVYSEEDEVLEYGFTRNPDLVMVDTEVISKAPARYLASGMADGLATWVEARACAQADEVTTAGGKATIAGLAIAEKCEEIIFKFGIQAYEANKAKVVTPALDAVVEANILLSGIGYESGGLTAAHSIHNGFTVLSGEIGKTTHGEKVAYGILTQLFLENRSVEELNRFIRFFQRIDLPTTLEELKIPDISYEELLKVGDAATAGSETIHRMPFGITAEDVADALLAVDAYVRSLS